jgi:hypothetical protein
VRICKGRGRTDNVTNTGTNGLTRSLSHKDDTSRLIPAREGIISTISISADISPIMQPTIRDKAVVPKRMEGTLSTGPSGTDAFLNAP